MNVSPCLMLDDYLARDLAAGDQARFRAHLVGCPECRAAVRGHERLDAVLTEAVVEFNPEAAGLTELVRRRLRARNRRRVALGITALAASVAGLWIAISGIPEPKQPGPVIADVQPAPAAEAKFVRVTFPAGANVLTVPVPSDSPNVTILMVYPTHRRSTEPAKETPPTSPQGRNS